MCELLTKDSESNPPEFVWKASEEREEALARVRREENVEGNRGIAVEMAEIVRRFCELHAT
jgi:hypothetical protein